MVVPLIDPKTLEIVRRVDTPTICNAIEVAQGKRGFDRFTRGTVFAADPLLPARHAANSRPSGNGNPFDCP